GMVTSAASGTPLVAAFGAMMVNLFLVFLPFAGRSLRDVSPALIDWLLERVSVVGAFQGSFLTGVLDSAHVVFFVAWTAVLLFLAVRLLEARRWWA
ncbi:MAG: hypothetical protein O7B99_05555, partial [Planctomycetota bacterium]|nr:hypothetical protein [Planctomycetota bacterium]